MWFVHKPDEGDRLVGKRDILNEGVGYRLWEVRREVKYGRLGYFDKGPKVIIYLKRTFVMLLKFW